jgi:hypothetical protein
MLAAINFGKWSGLNGSSTLNIDAAMMFILVTWGQRAKLCKRCRSFQSAA